jgi:hypothetical protein
MRRKFQAGLLLAILSLAGPVSLLGNCFWGTMEAGDCGLACCQTENCPMQTKARRTSKKSCPMGSGYTQFHEAMNCACSVAPQEPAALPSSLLVFELPPEISAAALPWAETVNVGKPAPAPDRSLAPPDQPPKSLFS